MKALPVEQLIVGAGSSNVKYYSFDCGWNPAKEAPKELCTSSDRSHIRRSRTIWLLRGEYRFLKYEASETANGEEVWEIEPTRICLGYAVFPLSRFVGLNNEGKEYEQWLPTGEHYFVSDDYGRGDVFACQYWREVDTPTIPIGVKDERYEWGTRYHYEPNFEDVPGQSKWLKDLRRSPNCDKPSWQTSD